MDESFRVLSEEGELFLCRGSRLCADGSRNPVLAMLLAAEHPPPFILDRLAHEYDLKDGLDGAWAARPLELVRERGRTMLLLEDPGGEPLARLLGAPMELGRFLGLAIGVAAALSKAHQRGLVHKDLKPSHNILVDCADGKVRLTGFGIASRLPRERQTLEPPETIAGTLAYMAPEQTGRMNRSIDSRSDLYSLGVTLYQMLTGALPFTATDPMEWVICHIARQPLAPSQRLESVPAPVSQIVMKLLAKTADERYQTAAGLERDLQRCFSDWQAQGRIDDFPLGQQDTPDRLLIPEKLYGRAHEVEILLASFDRIVTSGAPELVLVSGYSGIGMARREYERIWSLLGGRSIEELIDLPLMEDSASLATVDVLNKLVSPAWFTDANLTSLTICKAVSVSLERGNCDASCVAYVLLGMIAGSRFGDHKAGFRFGQLGCDLVERRGLKRFEASTYINFAAFVVRWMKHVRAPAICCAALLKQRIGAGTCCMQATRATI
jgi:serine/threonine protein kinase